MEWCLLRVAVKDTVFPDCDWDMGFSLGFSVQLVSLWVWVGIKEKKEGQNSPSQSIRPQASPSGPSRLVSQGPPKPVLGAVSLCCGFWSPLPQFMALPPLTTFFLFPPPPAPSTSSIPTSAQWDQDI